MVIKPSTLYLVGTPIGNLGDLSPRAAEVLAGVSFVAAEDTRVTGKLLRHLGITKPMVSYYEHNMRQRGQEILARLQGGESCALCSDAGMPAISDPGADIVRLCHEAGVAAEVVPGPSALTAALALSGLLSGRFCFEGFLSVNKRSRTQHLRQLAGETRAIVLFEAPHKLQRTLEDLLAALGDRRITLCREMTKLHEQTLHTTLAQAVELTGRQPPRGEYVLVLDGAEQEAEPPEADKEQAEEALKLALAAGMTGRDAVKRVSEQLSLPKNEVYALLTALQREE